MHRCLIIDEILQNVAAHLTDDQSRLRMALSCRTFDEPAMDSLWSDSLGGLKPLVQCLPEDATSMTDDDPNSIVSFHSSLYPDKTGLM